MGLVGAVACALDLVGSFRNTLAPVTLPRGASEWGRCHQCHLLCTRIQ